MRPYPAYKDSGVEWFPEIPEHWEVWKLAHAVPVISSGTTPSTEHPAYYLDGEIPWVNTGDLNDATLQDCAKRVTELAVMDHSPLKLYPIGSVVIALYGATIGKLGILGFSACVNQACCVLSPSGGIDSRYLFFWLLGFRNRIITLASGGGQPNISQEIVRSLRLALPPLPEQQAIARFLDKEVAKIDALVAEQRRLIALLAEKRQAVISHAVTKGLNPATPLKPSGIDWLGDIPEGWEVVPLRRLVSLNPSKSEVAHRSREEEVSFLPMEAVGQDGSLDLSRTRPIGEVETGYTYLRDGDVAFAKITPCFENGKGALMRGLAGGIAFGTTELTVLRPSDERLSHTFLACVVSSPIFLRLGEGHMYGAGGQKRVPDDFAREFRIALPSRSEQDAIVEHIKATHERFDALTAAATSAISLLQERRAALISAAVTGKIDLRPHFAQSLSEPETA